jgi:hypothetical protein
VVAKISVNLHQSAASFLGTDFMLNGATWIAAAIAGTPVFRIVVSSDSMKNATAISHGSSRMLEAANDGCGERASIGVGGFVILPIRRHRRCGTAN